MAKILIGITGSIAAYKVCDIIKEFKKKENEVICVITSSAKEFITPLTLRILSENPVYDDLFFEAKNFSEKVKHIELAQNCDIVLIAPATANIIGKVASGIADDLLSTIILATDKKVVFAPAMNTKMWENPIVQQNVEKLKNLGYAFIGPKKGKLACGNYGIGHIEDTEKIVKFTLSLLKKKSLNKKTVLIFSGPTREKIDDVRFITNASSGKTGYFLAEEAKARGAFVIFITGKTNFVPDVDIVENVESADDMFDKVKNYFIKADIIIGVAAVGDFKPEKIKGKIDRKKELILKLKPTEDILAFIGKKRKKDQVIIGFSAEEGENIKRAGEKLKKKNLDFIVVNDITDKKYGFESDFNKITILNKTGKKIFSGEDTKENLSKIIFDIIENIK